MAEVAHELLRQGQIQPKFLAHQLDRLLVGLLARGQSRRVARKHVHKQEHDHGYQQQRGDHAQKTFDDVGQH
ncbi:hypothetical protein D3C78_1579990 [compost metagenome]